MMKIKQFQIWIANLNPGIGTEAGKIRPVVVIQTDLLNSVHPSTIVCPISSNVQLESEILRIHLKKGMANLKEDCDILLDQIRSIDNKRFQKKIGLLPANIEMEIKHNLSIILDL